MATQQLQLPIAPPPAPRGGADARAGGLVSHRSGFWLVAYAFAVLMAFSAVPTPLYVLYARRDHFSGMTSTLIYAAYALGVIGSLFLLGHVSDWVGRRRVLLPAIAASMASGVIFILGESVPALVVARILSGVAVGMVTGTATAHLGELHARHHPDRSPRRAQLVAVAANLGGIGLGPLVSGLLAQYAGHPLLVPYLVFEGLLLAGSAAVALAPETAALPPEPVAYRPQRIAVPREARGQFAAAAVGGLVTFAVLGLFTSLAPAFLAGTLHDASHAVAGAVAFGVFAAAATAQIALMRLSVRSTLAVGIGLLPIGFGILSAATWFADLPGFVVGGLVTGAGAGLVFKGVLATSMGLAPAHARAEVLAGLFLASYIGLSVPIVILGIASQYVSTRAETAVFAAAVTLAVLVTAAKLLARRPDAAGPTAR
ncbi:MAG TPA: MFS transporter [Acidimicrobiales bacterium]|nr:MFS transporter [Acidimicrobiales bacterium]